jgi:hypothetical protein
MSTNEAAARDIIPRADNPFGNAPVVAAPGASAAALAQREIAEIQAGMVIAQRFPRNERKALDKILTNCQRAGLAEDATYEYARGGTPVTGASIRLAEELARSWGNIWCGVTELSRANGVSECLAYAWDLETGFRDEKRFQVRHWRDTRSGGKAITEERDIYEIVANMGARRKRACILAVIPSDVQEAALTQCEMTLKTKAEVTPERLRSLLEKFATYNVTREMIEKRIQRGLDAMQPAQLLGLGRIYNSMKDGMSTAADWFDMPAAAQPTEGDKPKTQTDAAKEALRAKTATDKPAEKDKPKASAKDADLAGNIPQHDAKTAVAAIRAFKTRKELTAGYELIVFDFVNTNRQVPAEVETAFADWMAHLESQES